MKYTSTRNRELSVTFEDAICGGYAPDGGLYVPEILPEVTSDDFKRWSSLAYPELAFEILRLFVARDELPDEVLRRICTSAFEGFEDPDTAVPVVKVGSLYVAELFHGPTFCFKDLGMRGVVNLLSYFSSLRDIKTTLVVATTGDTGPAAVQAVSDCANPLLTILVHYPNNQISEFQRRQLTTVESSCVRVAAFEGGGDDMDATIKRILTEQDDPSVTKRRMCGVNSYNIGRPLMQMVHYVWTYLRVVEAQGVQPGNPDVKVNFVIPTGAMGNIVGGYMAKQCGVPIGKLCAGTNVNDILFRAVQTGKFHKSEAMKRTLSEAINIQLPYNFERLLYYLTDCSDELVEDWMKSIDETNKLDLPEPWLARLQQEFAAARVTDDVMCETTRTIKDKYSYVADPHTAVAIAAATILGYAPNEPRDDHSPIAILSTASPCKFQESVTVALGKDGWKEYDEANFPANAVEVMERKEVEPVLYRKGQDWEKLARGIIYELGKTP